MLVPDLRRVLCPVDFSAPSRLAAARAGELAATSNASLTLLYVRPAVERAMMDSVHPESREAVARRLGELHEQLEELAAHSACEDVETDVVHGDPLTQILARSIDYDLLVIATHGRNALGDFLLGSTAERLVRGARCSVLLVR